MKQSLLRKIKSLIHLDFQISNSLYLPLSLKYLKNWSSRSFTCNYLLNLFPRFHFSVQAKLVSLLSPKYFSGSHSSKSLFLHLSLSKTAFLFIAICLHLTHSFLKPSLWQGPLKRSPLTEGICPFSKLPEYLFGSTLCCVFAFQLYALSRYLF